MRLTNSLADQPSHRGRGPLYRTLRALTLSVAVLGLAASPQLFAQSESVSDEEDKPVFPVVAINVASVDRVFEHIGFIFGSIDRSEVVDLIDTGMARFRDLKGLDRTRPGGLMILLSEGLAPLPVPVAYLPIEDIGEFGQTLGTVGAQFKPVPGMEDRYELIPQRGPISFVSVQGNYAFIGQNEQSIDRTFASPDTFAQSLAQRYDICASANLTKTPKSVRDLLLLTIKNSAQAAMQRRDNEPEAVYNLRRTNSEKDLHFVENVLRDGEEVTLGFKINQEQQHAALELIVRAKPDTAFARELAESTNQPSYFAAAIDETSPLSASVSARIPDPEAKTLKALFNLGDQELSRGLSGTARDALPEEIPEVQSVNELFDALRATIDERHLDVFAQFMGTADDKFVLIGGARIMNASQFGAGLVDILENASKTTTNFTIETGVDSHGDIVFHRLLPRDQDRGSKRTFGESPALYFGTDGQALWVAFGADDAIPTLKSAIDRVSQGGAAATRQSAPVRFIVNATEWIRLRTTETDRPRPFAELALNAFEADGSDVIRADIKPIENGFRLRIQLENGFLRLIGLAISGRIDSREDL